MERNKFSKIALTLFHWIYIFVTIVLYVLPKRLAYIGNPNRDIYKDFTNISKRMLHAFGVKYHQVGKIPDPGEALMVISNHTSLLDIFTFGVYFDGKRGVIFFDKKLLKLPIIGFFLKKMDGIAISVKTGEGAKEGLEKARKSLIEKLRLLIFPEGTRTKDGKLLPFKIGAAILAMRTGTSVLAVGTAGAFEVSNKSTWLLNPGVVVLYTGEVTEYNPAIKVDELNDLLRENVLDCVEKANQIKLSLI